MHPKPTHRPRPYRRAVVTGGVHSAIPACQVTLVGEPPFPRPSPLPPPPARLPPSRTVATRACHDLPSTPASALSPPPVAAFSSADCCATTRWTCASALAAWRNLCRWAASAGRRAHYLLLPGGACPVDAVLLWVRPVLAWPLSKRAAYTRRASRSDASASLQLPTRPSQTPRFLFSSTRRRSLEQDMRVAIVFSSLALLVEPPLLPVTAPRRYSAHVETCTPR